MEQIKEAWRRAWQLRKEFQDRGAFNPSDYRDQLVVLLADLVSPDHAVRIARMVGNRSTA